MEIRGLKMGFEVFSLLFFWLNATSALTKLKWHHIFEIK